MYIFGYAIRIVQLRDQFYIYTVPATDIRQFYERVTDDE